MAEDVEFTIPELEERPKKRKHQAGRTGVEREN